ncbi:DUF305 domain-containing protein [Rhizobium sp. R72]|uniref:DUF305 domain-containing protein n=1 Tax=unclassified Rhizobium TaxID=2613769 RepID=UPI000B765E1C|nr:MULTISPECIES: DUF305 domain-containing protein [unclassified Rhizobium]OWV97300.1 DUF305 domain-containing protein [Rhizobium sp. R72]OWV97639.1 DUF305 domain-containing protein [Rhizobium sp. R711]
MRDHEPAGYDGMKRHPYAMFAINMVLSLIVMYFVMFSMIDGWNDFRNNFNMLYMALTMVAPMGIIMLTTMGHMYSNKRLNTGICLILVILFAAAFAGTRSQAFIGNRQFIASMVPHHSGAILMCREASLGDPELVRLCSDISQSQRREIEQMNAIEARLARQLPDRERTEPLLA